MSRRQKDSMDFTCQGGFARLVEARESSRRGYADHSIEPLRLCARDPLGGRHNTNLRMDSLRPQNESHFPGL